MSKLAMRIPPKLDKRLEDWLTTSQFTYQEIFSMLLPLVLDQFFIFFLNILTSSLVSSSGQDTMTAVALVGPLSMIMIGLITAVAVGGTVIVVQYRGQGDENKVRISAGQVVMITFVCSVIFTLIMVVFAKPLIYTLFPSATQIVQEKAVMYMMGMALSIPAFGIFQGVFNVLRGVGETKMCLKLTIIINLLYLLASVVTINFMKLDILGTAISINFARIVGAIVAIWMVFSGSARIKLSVNDLMKFDWKMQLNVCKLGVPFATEQIFINFGSLLCQVYLAVLGDAVVAGNSIAGTLINLSYAGGFAVSNLAITVVGQCIGAKEIDLARKYGKAMIKLGTVFIIGGMLFLLSILPLLLSIFNPQPETQGYIYTVLFVTMIPMPFIWSYSYVTPNILRSAGDATYTSLVSLVLMWVFRVGVGYVLAIPMGYGVLGVAITTGVEWVVRSIMYTARFKGTKWYTNKLVD